MGKRDFLQEPVQHIDIKSFDSTPIIEQMRKMSFTAGDTLSQGGHPNRSELNHVHMGKSIYAENSHTNFS